ncbi:MAG: GntP family permease [Roseateles sp.]|uniref:GntP family permease n=1 Tax=Roseateles sp. TaxID=1971397 RepID=UPI00403537AE
MTSVAGILLALGLMIGLAYRGLSVLVLAPLCALVAVLFSPDAPLLASYTQVFMQALGGFVAAFFPLFLLGAIFGRLMEASGAATVIAQAIVRWMGAERAVPAIVAACALLTYGGVSLFVVAFAVFPVAATLFRQARLPRRLIPATIALGAFTFTMTALPGTPAIQNAIPMPFFGTTPFAAPGLGLIGGLVVDRAPQCGGAPIYGGENPASAATLPAGSALPPPLLSLHAALAPVLLVVALNYLLSTWLWPALDTAYLSEQRYGATTVQAVRGIWAVIGALSAAIVLMAVLWQAAARRHGAPGLKSALEEGAGASIMPLMNTASQVGFGAVIASLAGFALIRDALLGITPGNPLVSISIAVNLLAGITGSASGGMSIALQALGATWLEMGRIAGIAPDLLHRVIAIATGGLDALPHNGAVITLLGICGLTHRQSYFDIFVVAVVVPVLALVGVVVLGTMFGSF